MLTEDLEADVDCVAAGTLLARHWPGPDSGKRQDAALALCGGLARAGWDVDRIERFVEAVALAAHDDEVRMRINSAERTHQKVKDGEAVSGWPILAKLIGAGGGTL